MATLSFKLNSIQAKQLFAFLMEWIEWIIQKHYLFVE